MMHNSRYLGRPVLRRLRSARRVDNRFIDAPATNPSDKGAVPGLLIFCSGPQGKSGLFRGVSSVGPAAANSRWVD